MSVFEDGKCFPRPALYFTPSRTEIGQKKRLAITFFLPFGIALPILAKKHVIASRFFFVDPKHIFLKVISPIVPDTLREGSSKKSIFGLAKMMQLKGRGSNNNLFNKMYCK